MKAEPTSSERKLVFVVNEDPVMRGLIAAVLADAGFQVSQAADADDCARRLTKSAADLLVLAADGSGSNVVRHLRTLRPDLKTLILTDRPATRGDVDAVLHMPFHPDDIRDAVIALAFGRCRCPSCLRRRRGAKE